MKEVFKKLFGVEPMNAEDREAFALLPLVAFFGLFLFWLAAVLC